MILLDSSSERKYTYLMLYEHHVTVLESSDHSTKTLVRRPVWGNAIAWEGVSANAVLVSTVLLPEALASTTTRPWETMAFSVFFRDGEMSVDYSDLVCHRSVSRSEAMQNHDRVVRDFSEGMGDCDPETGTQYGDLT
jgi:hypothetical protein